MERKRVLKKQVRYWKLKDDVNGRTDINPKHRTHVHCAIVHKMGTDSKRTFLKIGADRMSLKIGPDRMYLKIWTARMSLKIRDVQDVLKK